MRIEGWDSGTEGLRPLPVVSSPPLVPDPTNACDPTRPALFGPMPHALTAPTILVFDSGLGGLTVYREVAQARPDARLVYAADDAVFPYGRLHDGELVARVVAVMENLLAGHNPDLVVVACNTASTIV